jgi:hypothetical protein
MDRRRTDVVSLQCFFLLCKKVKNQQIMNGAEAVCCTQPGLKHGSPTCYREYIPEHLQNQQPELFQLTRMTVFKQIH